MTRIQRVAKSGLCTFECRNGQIWNPPVGFYPCPICQSNSGSSGSK
jgi:hypothetical protein